MWAIEESEWNLMGPSSEGFPTTTRVRQVFKGYPSRWLAELVMLLLQRMWPDRMYRVFRY